MRTSGAIHHHDLIEKIGRVDEVISCDRGDRFSESALSSNIGRILRPGTSQPQPITFNMRTL